MSYYELLFFYDTLSMLIELILHTVHSEVDAALPREGVVRDGDLHLVCALVRQLQVVQQQRAVLEHHDAIAVFRSQVADDVGADGLDHSEGLLLVPLDLPLDDGLVGAAAGVTDRQEGLTPHRAPHRLGLARHIHP